MRRTFILLPKTRVMHQFSRRYVALNAKLFKSYILGRTGSFPAPASPWVAEFGDSSVSVSNGVSNEDNATVRSANTLVKWDDCLVRLLIESYKELKHLLRKGKVTKKDFFEKVACHFNKTGTVQVTVEQCQRKWLK